MKPTRRTVMGGILATLGLASGPSILHAQGRPPTARTLRAVMAGDLATYDPIWTTADIVAYHGAMVYDTLFSADANGRPQPQMVKAWSLSDDKLTYTFELRDGLRFTDNTPLTTADVVPSIRRWMARSGQGQLLSARLADLSAVDERTFRLKLKERLGVVLDMLSTTATPDPFIMRKREAETDPMQKIDRVIGSGPFMLNETETRAGYQYVYDKSPTYVPRSEPVSGMAGGKVVKVDRVVWFNMPDPQTAVAALQSGEIDFYEQPPIDMLDQLENDPAIVVEKLILGQVGIVALNWLYPPFDNAKCRQALLWIIRQDDMVRPTFVNPKWYRTCGSYFTCGSDMENDANTDWFKKGPDLAKAKQLLAEGGYDGRPIVMLQPTNMPNIGNAVTVFAEQLRGAGMKVDLQPMDWAGMVQRRASQNPPDRGGWNIFLTGFSAIGRANPYMIPPLATTGIKGWFGWASDEKNELLRAQWLAAETLEQRKGIAVQIQENAWNVVPHLVFGQFVQPAAHRKNVTGWRPDPELLAFWNVEKT